MMHETIKAPPDATPSPSDIFGTISVAAEYVRVLIEVVSDDIHRLGKSLREIAPTTALADGDFRQMMILLNLATDQCDIVLSHAEAGEIAARNSEVKARQHVG